MELPDELQQRPLTDPAGRRVTYLGMPVVVNPLFRPGQWRIDVSHDGAFVYVDATDPEGERLREVTKCSQRRATVAAGLRELAADLDGIADMYERLHRETASERIPAALCREAADMLAPMQPTDNPGGDAPC